MERSCGVLGTIDDDDKKLVVGPKVISSSPRAGPKGLRAESARAVTGRQCLTGGGGRLFGASAVFFL